MCSSDLSSSIQKASRPQKPKHPHPQTSIPTRTHPPQSQSGTPVSTKRRQGRPAKQGTSTDTPVTSSKRVQRELSKHVPKPPASGAKGHLSSSKDGQLESVARGAPASRVERSASKGKVGSPSLQTGVSTQGKRTSGLSRGLPVHATPTATPSRLLESMPKAHDILASQVHVHVHTFYIPVYCVFELHVHVNSSITYMYMYMYIYTCTCVHLCVRIHNSVGRVSA